jgi:hypothetical protein
MKHQNPTRAHIKAQLEAQRWQADQAARERPLQAESVILTVKYLIESGQNERARALVAEWRASVRAVEASA